MTAFFILLGVALVPFGAYFALIVLPYAFGLTIRAGRRWNPDLRWVMGFVVLAVAVISNSFWFDAFQCM